MYRFEGFLAVGDLQFSNKTGVRFAQKSYKSFKYSKIDLFDLFRFEGFLAVGDLQFSNKTGVALRRNHTNLSNIQK